MSDAPAIASSVNNSAIRPASSGVAERKVTAPRSIIAIDDRSARGPGRVDDHEVRSRDRSAEHQRSAERTVVRPRARTPAVRAPRSTVEVLVRREVEHARPLPVAGERGRQPSLGARFQQHDPAARQAIARSAAAAPRSRSGSAGAGAGLASAAASRRSSVPCPRSPSPARPSGAGHRRRGPLPSPGPARAGLRTDVGLADEAHRLVGEPELVASAAATRAASRPATR